jgi:hypothetical protein
MALRVCVIEEKRYPAMKTTPNINMPSYSQQAIRRGNGGAVRLSAEEGVLEDVDMDMAKNSWQDCRIAANQAIKMRNLNGVFRYFMLQCDNADCNSTGKRV